MIQTFQCAMHMRDWFRWKQHARSPMHCTLYNHWALLRGLRLLGWLGLLRIIWNSKWPCVPASRYQFEVNTRPLAMGSQVRRHSRRSALVFKSTRTTQIDTKKKRPYHVRRLVGQSTILRFLSFNLKLWINGCKVQQHIYSCWSSVREQALADEEVMDIMSQYVDGDRYAIGCVNLDKKRFWL